tara:strand:+ start:254 stop:637 length:384 start_codon:yes stop_codon:yes gene_type:complete
MIDLKLRLVKTVNVFILGNIFFFIGVYVSKLYKKYLIKEYDKDKTKIENTLQLSLEIGIICMTVYLIRIFVKFLNKSKFHPLRGIYNFNPIDVLELNGGVVLSFAFLMYVKEPIQSKLDNLIESFYS